MIAVIVSWKTLLVATLLLLVLPAVLFGGLYVVAVLLEPETRELPAAPVPGVKVRR